MKIFKLAVRVVLLSMCSFACTALETETMYRDPQPTEGERDILNEEAQPSSGESAVQVQIADDQSPDPEAFSLVVPHPEEGELMALLAAHSQVAIDMGRRPFVEFSAEWCPPCQALEASLVDPLMIEALRGIYLIRLDVDEWESQLAGSEFRIPGIPLFYELDANGRSTGRAISGSAWGEDIAVNMAPPLQAFFQANP